MVQSMAKLVEECEHVVVSQQCRSVPTGRQKIAHEICNRQCGSGIQALAADALVHPCATALVGARVSIEIKAADGLPVGSLDFEEAYVRVPDRYVLPLRDAYSEKPGCYFEEPCEHVRQRKIRPHLFLGDRVAAALQALGIEPHIPGRELAPRERLEVLKLFQCG